MGKRNEYPLIYAEIYVLFPWSVWISKYMCNPVKRTAIPYSHELAESNNSMNIICRLSLLLLFSICLPFTSGLIRGLIYNNLLSLWEVVSVCLHPIIIHCSVVWSKSFTLSLIDLQLSKSPLTSCTNWCHLLLLVLLPKDWVIG